MTVALFLRSGLFLYSAINHFGGEWPVILLPQIYTDGNRIRVLNLCFICVDGFDFAHHGVCGQILLSETMVGGSR